MKKYILLIVYFYLLVNFTYSQRQTERLNRGLIAIKTTNGNFVSWRMFGYEYPFTKYNLYRNGQKINSQPLNVTNYIDLGASDTSRYAVSSVINGIESSLSPYINVLKNNYLEIPLIRPDTGKTPDGVSYTYSPNDCSVGDLDGDGEYEIVVKWDPSNSKDNSQSGYTGNVYLDAYKLDGTFLWRIDLGINIRAGAHYTQFLVYDFDGDGKAEIMCKTAPGTKDGTGSYLSKGPAAYDNDFADYRNTSGYILSGPEYLTVFEGLTGKELATVNYIPERGIVSSWGDSYGNRVDRFLACVAYLDGKKPSAVFQRGYYTRMVLAAWDWDGQTLRNRWVFDSNESGNSAAYGQGNHNLSVGDVDFDGKDEIIQGSCAIDDNGKLMYATGLGHGDAMHLGDLDPNRDGLEVWQVHESASAAYGYELHEAATGKILWGAYTGTDNGRGLAANIDSRYLGYEMWSSSGSGTYNCKGLKISSSKPSINFRIYWEGDFYDELLDGISITKWNNGSIANLITGISGVSSINGTKNNPNLSADILGDWREEVIFRKNNDSALRIFFTTTPTDKVLYTLMHDPQYRLSIAWQNVAYNQPPHLGFYIDEKNQVAPVPPVFNKIKTWKSGNDWDIGISKNWKYNNIDTIFSNYDSVLFGLSDQSQISINIKETVIPSHVIVNSPSTYIFNGNGKISGNSEFLKSGKGTIVFNNNNDFSGNTYVYDGIFEVNGQLLNSKVIVESYGKIRGLGTFSKGIVFNNNGKLIIGDYLNQQGTLTIKDSLVLTKNASIVFDLSDDPSGITKTNDLLFVDGNIIYSDSLIIDINKLDFLANYGLYTLIEWTGSLKGDTSKIRIKGLDDSRYQLIIENKKIKIFTNWNKRLIWKGHVSSSWDNGKTSNWFDGKNYDIFVKNDTVIFDESSNIKNIYISENVSPAKIIVNNSSDISYVFEGNASIIGNIELLKSGTGTLKINNNNKIEGNILISGGTVLINNAIGYNGANLNINVNENSYIGGIGKIYGNVYLNDEAYIIPGNLSIGTIQIFGNIYFSRSSYYVCEINASYKLSDKIIVYGNVLINGVLYVYKLDTVSYKNNDSFKILDASNASGKFRLIIPSKPSFEMIWDTTNFCLNGNLKVLSLNNLNDKVFNEINLYPNPTNGFINIDFNENMKFIEIKIYDFTGRNLADNKYYNISRIAFNFENLNKGIYLLKIIINSKSYYVYKVIKQE